MSVNDAFTRFQSIVNADKEQVREARRRRDLFRNAFGAEHDVKDVIPSGSLARGTHRDPINDVDLIIIFDQNQHSAWGTQGPSAEEALDHTRQRVNFLLGATYGSYAKAVRLARWRNHAVKCFLDDPDDPEAFTVDAMPALRRDGRLLIPEAVSEDWVVCDPELLISRVATKHAQWNKYAGTVRMLKWWAATQDTKIKSLVIEVLALDCLPTHMNRPAAIKHFFVSAHYYLEGGNKVLDPAGLCGPIQSDLDYNDLLTSLARARDLAAKAFQSQANNDATSAVKYWGDVFGEGFPEPPTSIAAPATSTGPRVVKDTPQG